MTIIFDISKGGTHPNSTHKKLCKRLRTFTKLRINKESLTTDKLRKGCDLLVISSPKTKFDDDELHTIKSYVGSGGSLAVFSCEKGMQPSESNLNELLSEYGISIDNATLVRAVYHKYLHPKHALIKNGVVQPEIGTEKYTPLNETSISRQRRENTVREIEPEASMSLSFVYPNGTTLSVQSPTYTLLSSGSTSYPVDFPIAAIWESTDVEQGRVLVIGSSDIFADAWLDKESNSQLCDVLFRFLLRQNVEFDPSLGRSDFEEKVLVPDLASLSHLVKPCLEENAPLPQDYKMLICDDLFGLNNDHVPDVIDLYKQLNVPYGPLQLVPPQFELPPPQKLQMAVHQPPMPNQPQLEVDQFDLEECLSEDKRETNNEDEEDEDDLRVRLTNLADQFPDDLEGYLNEAKQILGLGEGSSPEEVLHKIGVVIENPA